MDTSEQYQQMITRKANSPMEDIEIIKWYNDPVYINMCEQAVGIQAIADDYCDDFTIACWHAPNHVECKGHFSDWHMGYKYCPVCGKSLKITPEYSICRRLEGDKITWLPRQDQLQAMVGSYNECFDLLDRECNPDRGDFAKLHYAYHSLGVLPFNSMEQLWLAFVMSERFRKYWNGEDWVSKDK